jgi:hypothetical protein
MVVDQLPQTVTGKIRKHVLKEQAINHPGLGEAACLAFRMDNNRRVGLVSQRTSVPDAFFWPRIPQSSFVFSECAHGSRPKNRLFSSRPYQHWTYGVTMRMLMCCGFGPTLEQITTYV